MSRGSKTIRAVEFQIAPGVDRGKVSCPAVSDPSRVDGDVGRSTGFFQIKMNARRARCPVLSRLRVPEVKPSRESDMTMNQLIATPREWTRRALFGARRCALAMLVCVIAIFAVAGPSAHAGPYVIDPQFNGGAVKIDRFSGTSNANYHGRKSVRLANGDVVVAGAVPANGQPDGVSTNIGLVRYTPQGTRVAWSGAGSFGFYNNEYVIWPNSSTSAYFGRITSVVDMLLIRNRICVLVGYATGATRFFGVECFRGDGYKLGTYPHFAVDYNQDPVGMAMYDTGNGFNVVIASRKETTSGAITGCYGGGTQCTVLAQYNVIDAPGASSDGTWYQDNVFGEPWTGGGYDNLVNVQSIAIGTRGDLEPYIYTAATLSGNGVARVRIQKWDSAGTALQRINPVFRGAPNRAEYNPIVTVDQVGGSAFHSLYVAAKVDEQCQPGTGVAKYTSTGASSGGFGSGGVLMMAGNDSAFETQDCAFAQSATPLAMTVADGMLAIAGYGHLYYEPSNYEPDDSGLLGILRKDTGAQISLRGYAMYTNQWIGSASFYGVTAMGSGVFMLSGEADEGDDGTKLMFGSARIGPPDKIFANGFQ